MHHIAILDPKYRFLDKIVVKQKTIESRWYKARFAPWNKISHGDIIYFKDSGKPVTVMAKVEKVIQFENLDKAKVEAILGKYGKQIYASETVYSDYYNGRKFCILIFLREAKFIMPFKIDKSGFGSAAAWLCVENIEFVKVNV